VIISPLGPTHPPHPPEPTQTGATAYLCKQTLRVTLT